MVTVQNSARPSSGVDFLAQPNSTLNPSPNQQLLPLTASVEGDVLNIGGNSVVDLVQQFGSPLYILDEHTLRTACRQYRQGLAQFYDGPTQVLYASKAWSSLAVCALVHSEGLGIDVVSGGELFTALEAGMDPHKIYLHGNNKSVEEIQYAIQAGAVVIADNWLDLNTLADLAQSHDGPTIRVMVRLTPGIECHTHDYIRTGHLDSKFGFDPTQLTEVFQFAQRHPQIQWIGLHAHIGSQIFETKPHADLTAVLVDWFIEAQSLGLAMTELNVGGGLGIRYTESDDPPSIEDWCRVVGEGISAACKARNLPLPKLLCEPGRSLIGSACVTAYRVGSQKEVPELRTYLSVDGGMSDNPRPITYQSQYRAVIANRMQAPATETVTVAGKHCESGDILLKNTQLPPCTQGDILVVMGTGAYNYSMASNYNRLPRPAAILVNNGEANLILRRETYTDLVRQDCLPQRLKGSSMP
ncbi:MAG TPA: diaminopimelate decarboxylase [Stenomitos sp.]